MKECDKRNSHIRSKLHKIWCVDILSLQTQKLYRYVWYQDTSVDKVSTKYKTLSETCPIPYTSPKPESTYRKFVVACTPAVRDKVLLQ